MASWKGFGKGLVSMGRNVPVIGELIPDEKVDPNSIDTGGKYYDQPASNARDLYDQALARSQASYQAGNIRDVDVSGADRLTGQQTTNLGSLQAAATGQAPSVAQAQYQAALGRSQNAALGMAAGSRGAGRGAARLQAISQFGANAPGNAAGEAAAVAQERQNALGQYTAALQGARGQDIGLATDRAGLQLNRDVASDSAGRNAFQATHNVQQGYLNTAGSALGQQAGIAEGQAGARQAQYQIALDDEERKRKARSGNRQAWAGMAKQGADAGLFGGKKPAAPAGTG